jgi:hypothetical protein
MGDLLDDMIRPEAPPASEEGKRFARVMAVHPRAKSSEEIEERAREYYRLTPRLGFGAYWPIPFFSADGEQDIDGNTYPDKLTKSQVASLREFFGMTEDEYREVIKRPLW